MSKYFSVEFQFGKHWEETTRTHTLKGAYEYISSRTSYRYPYRIIRVVKTIVFEEIKETKEKR